MSHNSQTNILGMPDSLISQGQNSFTSIKKQKNCSNNSFESLIGKGPNFFKQHNTSKVITNISLSQYLEIRLIERSNPFNQINQIEHVTPNLSEFSQQPMILFVYNKKNPNREDYTLSSILIDKYIILSAKWDPEEYIKSSFQKGLIDLINQQSYQSNIQNIETLISYCFENELDFYSSSLKEMELVNSYELTVKIASSQFIFKRTQMGIVYGFSLSQLRSINRQITEIEDQIKIFLQMKFNLIKQQSIKKRLTAGDLFWQNLKENTSAERIKIITKISGSTKNQLKNQKILHKQSLYRLREDSEESKVQIYFSSKP